MAQDIKLNSSEWCEMVFEGRNKSYGAYALRKTSSKRHIVAFLVTIVFVAVVVTIPAFLKAVTPPKVHTEGIANPYELEKIVEMDKQIEEQIIQPNTPPPPKLAPSLGFTPPIVTPDEMVDETRELMAQQEMNESNVRISIQTVISDNLDGEDIANVLTENRQITNDPPEDPRIYEVVPVMPQFPGG